MRTAGGYKTRQRDTILSLLKSNTEKHLSAEEITELLRQNGHSVGITTVYRYLEKLYEQGVVQKYTADKERARYTYSKNDCREHFHMKCTECGRLFCADCDFLEELKKHIGNEHNFCIVPSKTIFYGICKACAEKESTN